jgi:hypothetical protein
MKNRSLVLAGALTLASLSLLSAKTYDITLSSPTKAGTVELKPGEYKLKVQGSNVVFTNVDTSKTYTTPAKLQTQSKKYDVTAVETTKAGDTDKLMAIELGGSPTELQFGE